VLALVDLLARAGRAWLGEGAVYAVAAISGIADVDAITLALGAMVAGTAQAGMMDARAAALGVAIAVATNFISKATIATGLGGVAFGARYAVPALLGLAAGAAVLVASR